MSETQAQRMARAAEALSHADDGLTHLTCGEIQPLVELFVHAGHIEQAEAILASHAYEDGDVHDLHHEIYQAIQLVAETEDWAVPLALVREMIASIKRGEPSQKWRLVYGDEVAYYDTKAARDDSASNIAEARRCQVLTEVWSPEHDQGPLNLGWACDGAVDPPEEPT